MIYNRIKNLKIRNTSKMGVFMETKMKKPKCSLKETSPSSQKNAFRYASHYLNQDLFRSLCMHEEPSSFYVLFFSSTKRIFIFKYTLFHSPPHHLSLTVFSLRFLLTYNQTTSVHFVPSVTIPK